MRHFQLSLLTLLLTAAFFIPRPVLAQFDPPSATRVLKADTVNVVGADIEWRMRYFDAKGSRNAGFFPNPWVEVEDPYGGQVRIPSVYFLSIASDLTTFIEGTEFKSVLFIQRSLVFPIVLVLLVGLISLVAIPIIRYRKPLRRERQRRQQMDEVHRRLAEGQQAERVRIAQYLHDGPVQDLHAVRMRLSMIDRQNANGRGATRADDRTLDESRSTSEKTSEVVQEIQRVIRDLRGMSEDLRPPALGPFGLAAALRTFAQRCRANYSQIDVDLNLDDDDQALPEPVRLALFRIAQESMNNAAQHGAPDTISVTLRLNDEHVSLSICDDGVGFDVPDDLRSLGGDGHYGMLGMVERAEFIGADLHIESHPGTEKPTCVQVKVRRDAVEWRHFYIPDKAR